MAGLSSGAGGYGAWRLVHTGLAEAAWNMAVDEAIMIRHREGLVPPTLRFYGWEPAAVSIGYFQDLERTIDREACRRSGVRWVRRITGGRAVFHHREVTYGLIAAEHLLPKSVSAAHLLVSQGLIRGLGRLGVASELGAGGPAGRRAAARGVAGPAAGKSGSAACFDSALRHEVGVEGRKLVGSAQARRGGVVLQHGSLPLAADPGRFCRLLRFPGDSGEDDRGALREKLAGRATSLADVLGGEPEPALVCAALAEGLAEALGVRFVRGELSSGERETAGRLAEDKYATEDWNARRVRGGTGVAEGQGLCDFNGQSAREEGAAWGTR